VVDADPEEHWFDASGHVLQPSRWISPDTPEEDDTYGRCIGLRCRPWQRCQKAEDMVHTMFGGSSSDCTQGWAALTRPSIASGAPNFYGGLKVLASLQVILGQFLHEEAGGWFPSLRLPPPNELLTMLAVCNPNYPMLFRYFIAHDNSMTTRLMPCAPVWNLRERKKSLERSACLAAWQLATRP